MFRVLRLKVLRFRGSKVLEDFQFKVLDQVSRLGSSVCGSCHKSLAAAFTTRALD